MDHTHIYNAHFARCTCTLTNSSPMFANQFRNVVLLLLFELAPKSKESDTRRFDKHART